MHLLILLTVDLDIDHHGSARIQVRGADSEKPTLLLIFLRDPSQHVFVNILAQGSGERCRIGQGIVDRRRKQVSCSKMLSGEIVV